MPWPQITLPVLDWPSPWGGVANHLPHCWCPWMLRNTHYSEGVETGIAEVLGLVYNVTCDNKKHRIKLCHLQLAFRNDRGEQTTCWSDSCRGRVLPPQPILLAKMLGDKASQSQQM